MGLGREQVRGLPAVPSRPSPGTTQARPPRRLSQCLVTSWFLRSCVCLVSEHVQTGHTSVCSCPLCSLPVCLQLRPCRETPSWSWRAAPWPLSHPGMASWRPVPQFPRSRGKTGRARARAVLSVCDPLLLVASASLAHCSPSGTLPPCPPRPPAVCETQVMRKGSGPDRSWGGGPGAPFLQTGAEPGVDPKQRGPGAQGGERLAGVI